MLRPEMLNIMSYMPSFTGRQYPGSSRIYARLVLICSLNCKSVISYQMTLVV